MTESLVAFSFVAVGFVATPGVTTLLVFRAGLSGGPRAGLTTAAGAALGSMSLATASAIGFSAVLRASPNLHVAFLLVGAAYLIGIGWQDLRGSKQPAPLAESKAPDRSSFSRGYHSTLLNPALWILYFLVVPGFVPAGAPVWLATALLTAVHTAIAFSFHCGWSFAGAKLGQRFLTPASHRRVQIASGLCLWFAAVLVLKRIAG